MSSKKTNQIPEITPAAQLPLLRRLLRTAQEEIDATDSVKSTWVEGDLFHDPLPAYTNVSVDFDLLSCRLPKQKI